MLAGTYLNDAQAPFVVVYDFSVGFQHTHKYALVALRVKPIIRGFVRKYALLNHAESLPVVDDLQNCPSVHRHKD